MKKINNKLDVVYYFATKLLSGILSFVAVSLYTYYISPEIYGNYSLVTGLINIILAIFIGWVSSSCLRYYSNYKNDEEIFYSNVIVDWILMSVLSLLTIFILGLFVKSVPISQYLLFAELLFLFNGTYEILCSVLRATQKTKLYFFIVVGEYIVCILLFIILNQYSNMSINAIFISTIIAKMFVSIITFKLLNVFKKINFSKISKDIQLKFLKYGLPMIGVWATSWLLSYSDRYIIKIFFSTYEVGLYDIATKLSENSINMLITSLSMAMLPILINKYNTDGEKEALKIYEKFLSYFYILVIPSIVGLISIRTFIYGTIISQNYVKGVDIIIYISISMFFLGFNQFIYKLWQLKEKTNMILLFMIISVIINIILNIIFIPLYGYIFAAITTLLSNVISTILSIIFINKYFNVNYCLKVLLKAIISSLAMYIFILLFKNFVNNILMFIIMILISISIYFLLMLLFGEMKDEFKLFVNKLKYVIKNKGV